MKQSSFAGKLLVCDMDGTLLNSKNEVSVQNRNALEQFVECGGLFTLATGRTSNGVEQYLDKLPVNAPAILINGCQIFDLEGQKALWKSHCLQERIQDVIKNLLYCFPRMGIEIFYDGGVHVIRENYVTEWHRHKEKIHPGVVALEDVPMPWYKIVLAWDCENLKKVESYLLFKAHYFRTVFSEEVFMDLLDLNTSKGHALEKLTGIIGCPMANVIAVGDSLNDLEMIKTAGVGIAVKNAHAALKDKASCCTCSNDDHAVAEIIKWIEENMGSVKRVMKTTI